jgi:hypothetical protein
MVERKMKLGQEVLIVGFKLLAGGMVHVVSGSAKVARVRLDHVMVESNHRLFKFSLRSGVYVRKEGTWVFSIERNGNE